MERSADRSLVILKWKKYGKDHSSEFTTDSDSFLSERQRRAQPQQTSSKIANPQRTIHPFTIGEKQTI